eukprot:TRINITY_DN16835_c0_g1_i1.p1 TRINITY_DN16835_c0_g1~~TRINITY_DN16835_c0_g1_i1.p1  ORF type:complete len:422 (+),score=30.88 TRINITY_DN16835_c0_g1_i1:92-1357(+)
MAGVGRTLFVAGGSGFIGSNVCKEAIRTGFEVISLSRTGRPEHIKEKWVDRVQWVKGDVMHGDTYKAQLRESTNVVSCIGKFGIGRNNSVYEANADTNIYLAHLTASECPKLTKFGYISAFQYSMWAQKPFQSYYNSKMKAEVIIQSLFPKKYFLLRPNWVFGWKHVAGPVWLPTQLIGNPIEHFMQPIAEYCSHTKFVVPPTHVDEIAHIACLACTVGKDVCGLVPSTQIHEIMQRQAQGRELKEFSRRYISKTNREVKDYLDNVSYVEKYGLAHAGKMGSAEKHYIQSKRNLHPAFHREEVCYPLGQMHYFEDYYTPTYTQIMLEGRKQKLIEGRKTQLLFENAQRKLKEDGLLRLEGEIVGCDRKILLEAQRRSLDEAELFQDLPTEAVPKLEAPDYHQNMALSEIEFKTRRTIGYRK